MMEGIELEFEEEALLSVVEKAQKRKTGARALRSILEETMMPIMYNIPDMKNVKKCIITKNVIEKGDEPIFIFSAEEKLQRKAS